MQVSLLVGLSLFSLGVGLVIVANFVIYMVIGEINARSGTDQQIGMFFLQTKTAEILRRHRELFPESPKRRRMVILGVTGVALIFAGFLVAVSSNFVSKG
jgi:hypothetical protein